MNSSKTSEKVYYIDKTGVSHSASALFAQHESLVRGIVGSVARRARLREVAPALLSYGFEGLLRAADRYDPSREVPFSAYARYKIRGHVLNSLSKELSVVIGSEYGEKNEICVCKSSNEMMHDPVDGLNSGVQMRRICQEVDKLPESRRQVLRGVLKGESLEAQAQRMGQTLGKVVYSFRLGCNTIRYRINERVEARKVQEDKMVRMGLEENGRQQCG